MRGIAGGLDLLAGLVLLTTFGLPGFAGTAGEDNLLAQLVGSISIVMLVSVALAVLVAARPARGRATGLAGLLLLTGILLFLFTVFQIGLPNIALGIGVLLARRKL